MAAPPARPSVPEKSGLPSWAVFTMLGMGGVLTLAVAIWLLFGGGVATLMRAMPDGVAKTFGERAGEGKKVEQTLHDYPLEKPDKAMEGGKKAELAADAEPVAVVETSPEELLKLLQPMLAQAKSTDRAIESVREGRGKDQGALQTAETAVAALRGFSLKSIPQHYRKEAEAKREELAQERAENLTSAKRLAVATHLVALPHGAPRDSVVLRESASESSANVAILEDGVLLHLHLDTGKGWARVDAVSGSAGGKAGYLPTKFVKRLPDAR